MSYSYRSDHRRPRIIFQHLISNLNQQPPLSLSHLSSFSSVRIWSCSFSNSHHLRTLNATSTHIHTTTTHNRRSARIFFADVLCRRQKIPLLSLLPIVIDPKPQNFKQAHPPTTCTYDGLDFASSPRTLTSAPASFRSIIYSIYDVPTSIRLRPPFPTPTRPDLLAPCVARARTPPSLHFRFVPDVTQTMYMQPFSYRGKA